MKKIASSVLIFCFAITNHSIAYASTDNSEQSLHELMQASVASHPSLKIKQSQLTSAQFNLSAAEWSRYPTLGLNTRSLSDGTSVVASIEQPLWTGGKITGEIDKAFTGKDVAENELSEAQLTLLLQVNEAYFNLKALQLRLVEAQSNVTEHQNLLQIIERRVASQVSPKADDLFAQSRLRSAVSESIQIKRELQKAKNTLVQLTNQPITSLTLPSIQKIEKYNLQQLIDLAFNYSPNKQRLLSEVKLAEADIKLAKAQALPNIVLGFQSNLGVDDLSSGRDGLFVGLQVESGAGLSAVDNIKASSASAEAAKQQIALYEIQLRQQIQDSWAEYETLLAELEPLEFSYDASVEVIESYIRQFRIGKKSWQDVMNAQKEKTQNAYQLTDAQMKILQVTISLKLQTGIIHFNNLEILR